MGIFVGPSAFHFGSWVSTCGCLFFRSTGLWPPALGDPLPGDALFLVSSLHIRDRHPRALRAWEAGLQAGAVLRGEFEVPNSTPEGDGCRPAFPRTCAWCCAPRIPRCQSSVGRASRGAGCSGGPFTDCLGPSGGGGGWLPEGVADTCRALLVDFSLEVASFVARYLLWRPRTGPTSKLLSRRPLSRPNQALLQRCLPAKEGGGP